MAGFGFFETLDNNLNPPKYRLHDDRVGISASILRDEALCTTLAQELQVLNPSDLAFSAATLGGAGDGEKQTEFLLRGASEYIQLNQLNIGDGVDGPARVSIFVQAYKKIPFDVDSRVLSGEHLTSLCHSPGNVGVACEFSDLVRGAGSYKDTGLLQIIVESGSQSQNQGRRVIGTVDNIPALSSESPAPIELEGGDPEGERNSNLYLRNDSSGHNYWVEDSNQTFRQTFRSLNPPEPSNLKTKEKLMSRVLHSINDICYQNGSNLFQYPLPILPRYQILND